MGKKYTIARAVDGISLNGKEYVMTDEGDIMLFSSEKKAYAFLEKHGYAKEEIDDDIMIEEYGE